MKTHKQLTIEDYENINKITKNITMGDVDGRMSLIADKYQISKEEAHKAMKICEAVANCIWFR